MHSNRIVLSTGEAITYKELWECLSFNIPANLAFASLVSKEEYHNLSYFLGDYSLPILKWIVISVYSNLPVEDTIPAILGEYYEFVSSPINNNGKAGWHQLTSYKGSNDQKLKSWLMTNGKRWFVRQKLKDMKQTENETGLLDFVDYESLLSIESNVPDVSDEDLTYRDRLSKAWDHLSEKDKNVLHYLIIEKTHWSEAYEKLNVYINPKVGRVAMLSWDNKRKQDALAMMKARAIEHLIARFNQIKF